jgi:hypothetical protein
MPTDISKFDDTVDVLTREDPSFFDPLFYMLNKINVPLKSTETNNSRKGFSKHRSMTFGIVKVRYSGTIGLSRPSVLHPAIYAEILRIARVIAPNFKFSSVHLNKNVVCPPHTDDNNVGKSLLVSFGDYEGCELVVGGKVVDTKNRPVIFDGSRVEHMNLPMLAGTKYSLVYFNTKYREDSNSK